MRLARLVRFLVLVALIAALQCGSRVQAQETRGRLALVIGNATWNGHRLPTASADAGLVAQALAQDGFAVTAVADPDTSTLRSAVEALAAQAREAGPKTTIVVYIAGLGVQYAGANYLVLVGAPIAHQADVPTTAFALADLVRPLEAVPASRRIFVYDLARTSNIGAADGAPLASGLAAPVPAPGSFVAFNAAPGSVAAVQVPPYGLYARALAEMLRTPGLTLRELFTRVRLRAAEMSGGATIPWDQGDLGDEVLLPAAVGAPTPVAVQERAIAEASAGELYWAAVAEDRLDGYRAFVQTFPDDRQSVRLRGAIATRLEALTWSAAGEANTPSAYWTFMQRFPRGPHYVDVRRRLEALHAPLAPPPRFDVYPFEGLPLPTTDEVAAVANPALAIEDAEWPQLPPPPSGLLPPPPLAFNVELAPPPLVPDGVLPVPAALPLVGPTARPPSVARIEQPFARQLGHVAIETSPDGATLVSTEGAPLLKVTSVTTRGDRTILESDAAGETVSRTTTVHGDATITTTQTGPKGGILSRIFTRLAPDATRTTTITDGRNQLVAEVRTDARGVIVGVTRGPAVFDDETFALASPDHPARSVPPPAPTPPPKPPSSETNVRPPTSGLDAPKPSPVEAPPTAVAIPPRPPMPALPPLSPPVASPPKGPPPKAPPAKDVPPPVNAVRDQGAPSTSPAPPASPKAVPSFALAPADQTDDVPLPVPRPRLSLAPKGRAAHAAAKRGVASRAATPKSKAKTARH